MHYLCKCTKYQLKAWDTKTIMYGTSIKVPIFGWKFKYNKIKIHVFCFSGNIYALRANLSIAIVAMVAKYNVTNESSTVSKQLI